MNTSPHGAFYYIVSDELKQRCVSVIMFRIYKHNFSMMKGYVWNYFKKDEERSEWTDMNFMNSVKICNVDRCENTIFYNTIWFNMDDGEFKDLPEDILREKAIKAFTENYKKMRATLTDRIKEIDGDITYLRSMY